jgi:hypothetical protein
MIDTSPYDARKRVLAWSVSLFLVMTLAGCTPSIIIRVVNQGTDGNSEFWVCKGSTAQQCRGERQGDIDPAGYQKRLQVVAPPGQCTNQTVATMDIVIEKGSISQVRYQCGLPATPGGLPTSPTPSNPGTETPRSN